MSKEKLKWTTEKRKVKELVPYEKNPRRITEKQREQLEKSLSDFDLVEIPAINTDNIIIAGHQRMKIMILQGRGEEEIDVRVPNRKLTKRELEEYNIRSNKNTGEWDWEKLAEMDREMLLEIGFDDKEVQKIMDANERTEKARATLAERFIMPPFSILDSRKGEWQKRERAWYEIINVTGEKADSGGLGKSKEGVLYKEGGGGDPHYYKAKERIKEFLGRDISNEEFEKKYYEVQPLNDGSSVFDPVLTELMYTWFAPKGGKALDPFAGEQTKGVVAGEIGMEYTGVELREEQVEINNKACSNYKGVKYHTGDSNDIDKIVKEKDFDIIFTSPPYYDLEIYSKEDLSALGTYEEFMEQYKNIFKKAISKLKDDRFVVVKVGEIRDKKTGEYRNFVGDNIALFKELGLHYYNEIIFVNCISTLPFRVTRPFNTSRKIGKTHQNLLTFYKGEAQNLFKEEKAVWSIHQNLLAFFKGNPDKIKDQFGNIVVEQDIIFKEDEQ